MSDAPNAMDSAAAALSIIMRAMSGRRLLARGIKNGVIRERIESEMLTDEQLETIAANAFRDLALAAAKDGRPGYTAFACNPSEEP